MATSLSQLLPPGIQGFESARSINSGREANNLGQLSSMLQLQGVLQKQQQEQQFRSELAALGPNPDEKDLAALARKHLGPAGIDSSLARRAATDQTKQIAMARLGQQINRDAADIAHKARTATSKEEKDHWQQQMDVLKANAQKHSAEIAAGRYNYDTGGTVAPFQGVVPTPGATTMPQAVPVAPVPTPQGAVDNRRGLMGTVSPADPAVVANLDAGRSPNGGPAIPSSAVLTPKPLSLADAPPGLTPRKAQEWLLAQSKPSIAGGGQFTPQALEFTAKQYLAGDRQATQGFARSATARIALQNAIVDEASKQGLSPQQTAAKMAEFAGTVAGSRTVGQRAANISLAATEAHEMIDIVKESSDKFGRTSFVPWNMALRAYESGTGSPEIAAFGASVNALVNVYARAINPTGVPTVSDKDHARAVLNTVQSPQQVDAVLGIIKRELEIAMKAPQQVRESIRGGITGDKPATTKSSDQDLINKYLNR